MTATGTTHTGPERDVVYKALHLPLTMLDWTGFPIDRRMFWLGVTVGGVAYGVTTWFVAGALCTLAVWGFGRWAITRDPHMLQLILQSHQLRRRYDPGKGHPEALDSPADVIVLR